MIGYKGKILATREETQEFVNWCFTRQQEKIDKKYKQYFKQPYFLNWHNYEIENYMNEFILGEDKMCTESFDGFWVISEYCKYDGKYCAYGYLLEDEEYIKLSKTLK